MAKRGERMTRGVYGIVLDNDPMHFRYVGVAERVGERLLAHRSGPAARLLGVPLRAVMLEVVPLPRGPRTKRARIDLEFLERQWMRRLHKLGHVLVNAASMPKDAA